jgi:hypothetical protein
VGGIFLEDRLQRAIGVGGVVEVKVYQGFADQEPRITGNLCQPFLQWLESGFILAAVQQPLGSFDVGFDFLATPFVFLTAAAGTG